MVNFILGKDRKPYICQVKKYLLNSFNNSWYSCLSPRTLLRFSNDSLFKTWNIVQHMKNHIKSEPFSFLSFITSFSWELSFRKFFFISTQFPILDTKFIYSSWTEITLPIGKVQQIFVGIFKPGKLEILQMANLKK